MDNEEKNISAENEAAEENINQASVTPEAPAVPVKKLSGGVIGAIIGGVVALIAAIVLLVTLLPGNDNGGGEGDGGNTDTKVTYTVTVVDADGNAIKGAKVTFSPKGATAIPFTTDANGKASYKTDKKLTVTVTSIPSGYEYDKLNQAQSFDKDGNLTVTITKLAPLAPLVILVIDQYGNAVPGVKVQMCDDTGSCRKPVTTNAEGKGSYAYEEGSFHAQLTNGLSALPEGYTVAEPDKYYSFVDGVATITVTKIAD